MGRPRAGTSIARLAAARRSSRSEWCCRRDARHRQCVRPRGTPQPSLIVSWSRCRLWRLGDGTAVKIPSFGGKCSGPHLPTKNGDLGRSDGPDRPGETPTAAGRLAALRAEGVAWDVVVRAEGWAWDVVVLGDGRGTWWSWGMGVGRGGPGRRRAWGCGGGTRLGTWWSWRMGVGRGGPGRRRAWDVVVVAEGGVRRCAVWRTVGVAG
jgi:hypothetical protein